MKCNALKKGTKIRCTKSHHSGYTLACPDNPEHSHYFCADHYMKDWVVVDPKVCVPVNPQLKLW